MLHNAAGQIGVLEGNGGMLRGGLPWQPVHDGTRLVHNPLRLTVVIEAPTSAIGEILARHDAVRALFDHHWLRLLAIDRRIAWVRAHQGTSPWRRAALETALAEDPVAIANQSRCCATCCSRPARPMPSLPERRRADGEDRRRSGIDYASMQSCMDLKNPGFEQQISLRQLRYLVALAEQASFTRAAAAAGVSQPSLSQAIRQLEDALGAPLVERGARAHLTPLGREVAARAQRILLEVRDLGELVEAGDAELLGTIRLGVTPTVGAYLLPRLVARLHQQFHELRVHVRENSPALLVEGLAAGAHDVILAQLPLQSPGTHAERLFREPLLLAMAADHPLAARDTIRREDLAGQDLLTLQRGYRLADQTIAIAEEAGAQVREDYEGTSLDAIRQMAGMGMGLAVLPELYVRQEIRPGDDVVARPFHAGRHYRELGLLWRSGVARAAAYKRLAQELVACAQDIGISYR